MGFFRFRRSVKILPGVRWNLGKRGSSVSFGGRGLHYTIGPSGTRTTVGLPGTGLSYTSVHHRPRAQRLSQAEIDRATTWADAQEETFHLEFPDREPSELPATPGQIQTIRQLVRSVSGTDLPRLGARQAEFLISEIKKEKAAFTERKVHEYLDRRTRSSGTGCVLLFLLLAGLAILILQMAH